jgi:hypothetical protein
LLDAINERDYFRARKARGGIVIGSMSLFLHRDKRGGELNDLRREAKIGYPLTSIFCKPMIERTVDMPPAWIIMGLTGSD